MPVFIGSTRVVHAFHAQQAMTSDGARAQGLQDVGFGSNWNPAKLSPFRAFCFRGLVILNPKPYTLDPRKQICWSCCQPRASQFNRQFRALCNLNPCPSSCSNPISWMTKLLQLLTDTILRDLDGITAARLTS